MLILSGYAAQPHSQTPDFLALSEKAHTSLCDKCLTSMFRV